MILQEPTCLNRGQCAHCSEKVRSVARGTVIRNSTWNLLLAYDGEIRDPGAPLMAAPHWVENAARTGDHSGLQQDRSLAPLSSRAQIANSLLLKLKRKGW